MSDNLDELIACPNCDALYRARIPRAHEKAVCSRCHHVLITPRTDSYVRVIAMAVTVMILMVGAVLFPFLSVNVQGFSNNASVLDTALAFVGQGWQSFLVFATAGFIIGIPLLRAALVIYVLAPLVSGAPAFRGAKACFRICESLRPWSMAEIFVIGCAVALVKVSDLARVDYGPAFWMFAVLVVAIVFQDGLMCRWSIWRALEARRPGRMRGQVRGQMRETKAEPAE